MIPAIKSVERNRYRNPALCRVPGSLLCAFYLAHDKNITHGENILCRVLFLAHGKAILCCVFFLAHGEVMFCRVFYFGTRQNNNSFLFSP